LAIVLGVMGAIVWYAPYLALAAVVVLVAVGLISHLSPFLGRAFVKWFERSPQRVRLWQHALITTGHFFSIVVPLALIVGGMVAIWAWYPFQSIGNIPLAQITLNQILTNLGGGLLFLGLPVVIANVGFQPELGEEAFYSRGKFVVLLVLVLIALSVGYLFAPTFFEDVFYKWRSDFYRLSGRYF
jgi:hypothetical protein